MFIITMTPPRGPVEYYPKGFGFSCHAHTMDKDSAERFPDADSAWRRANAYRCPPAFWNSERMHRERMERQFRGWRFDVIPA